MATNQEIESEEREIMSLDDAKCLIAYFSREGNNYEEYDFSGKKIVPFCTHEGSGLGHSEQDIAKLCPKATLLKGLAIHGSGVNDANKDIANWLDKVSADL